MTHEALMGTTEVAEAFHVSRKSVWNWIREGKLRAIKTPGGQYKVRRSDVASYLDINESGDA